MAETVAGKVGENISSVYSMLRQTTCDIQEHIETAIGAPIDNKLVYFLSFYVFFFINKYVFSFLFCCYK